MSNYEDVNRNDDEANEIFGGGKKKSRALNILFLLLPLFLGVIVFITIFIVSTISYKSMKNNVSLTFLSKKNVEESTTIYGTDSKIYFNVQVKNASNKELDQVRAHMTIKDKSGRTIWNGNATFGNYIDTISPKNTSVKTVSLSSGSSYSQEYKKTYNTLWNLDSKDLTVSFEITGIDKYDYPQGWYSRASFAYTLTIILTATIASIWMIVGISRKCPKCKFYFATKEIHRKEVDRRSGSIVEHRTEEIDGHKISYDERVYGQNVTYLCTLKCKHCGEKSKVLRKIFEKE